MAVMNIPCPTKAGASLSFRALPVAPAESCGQGKLTHRLLAELLDLQSEQLLLEQTAL